MSVTFGRVIRVTVGPPGVPEGARVFGNTREGGIGHHVAFNTQAGSEGRAAECRLQVWNLSEESIALFEERGNKAIIQAGYKTWRGDTQGPMTRVVFQGNPDPTELKYRKQGGDWVLEALIKDGGQALDYGRLDVSLKGSTEGSEVVDSILAGTGLSRGIIDIDDVTFRRRFVFSGPTRRGLDLLVSTAGGGRRWFVRDGALYIMKKGAATPETAPIFSSKSGNLVDAPERIEGGGVEFKGMLHPAVRVGSVVIVESRRISGTYRVTNVSYSADNTQGAFQVAVKGVPYGR